MVLKRTMHLALVPLNHHFERVPTTFWYAGCRPFPGIPDAAVQYAYLLRGCQYFNVEIFVSTFVIAKSALSL